MKKNQAGIQNMQNFDLSKSLASFMTGENPVQETKKIRNKK
jgi:hypothetical protein